MGEASRHQWTTATLVRRYHGYQAATQVINALYSYFDEDTDSLRLPQLFTDADRLTKRL